MKKRKKERKNEKWKQFISLVRGRKLWYFMDCVPKVALERVAAKSLDSRISIIGYYWLTIILCTKTMETCYYRWRSKLTCSCTLPRFESYTYRFWDPDPPTTCDPLTWLISSDANNAGNADRSWLKLGLLLGIRHRAKGFPLIGCCCWCGWWLWENGVVP